MLAGRPDRHGGSDDEVVTHCGETVRCFGGDAGVGVEREGRGERGFDQQAAEHFGLGFGPEMGTKLHGEEWPGFYPADAVVVTAYRLAMRGTVEERILALQAKKRGLVEAALDDRSPLMELSLIHI